MLIPLRDDLGPRGSTPVTWLLCAVWLGLFAVSLLVTPADLELLHGQLGLRPATWWTDWGLLRRDAPGVGLTRLGRVALPLLAHPLLHGGVLHVLSNVVAFALLGARLEQRAGSRALLGFVALAAMVGSAVELGLLDELAGGARRDVLGGSAIVAASFGAYLTRFPRASALVVVPVLGVLPVLAEVRVWVLLVVWAVFQARPVTRLLEIGPSEPMSFGALAVAGGAGVVVALLASLRGRARAAPG